MFQDIIDNLQLNEAVETLEDYVEYKQAAVSTGHVPLTYDDWLENRCTENF